MGLMNMSTKEPIKKDSVTEKEDNSITEIAGLDKDDMLELSYPGVADEADGNSGTVRDQ